MHKSPLRRAAVVSWGHSVPSSQCAMLPGSQGLYSISISYRHYRNCCLHSAETLRVGIQYTERWHVGTTPSHRGSAQKGRLHTQAHKVLHTRQQAHNSDIPHNNCVMPGHTLKDGVIQRRLLWLQAKQQGAVPAMPHEQYGRLPQECHEVVSHQAVHMLYNSPGQPHLEAATQQQIRWACKTTGSAGDCAE